MSCSLMLFNKESYYNMYCEQFGNENAFFANPWEVIEAHFADYDGYYTPRFPKITVYAYEGTFIHTVVEFEVYVWSIPEKYVAIAYHHSDDPSLYEVVLEYARLCKLKEDK